ncbi:hypothetical protein CD798_16005 [Bacillaceae bacterium SAOS 7]|nr:hypothetical protein CD798_16005 [Bacillaceae bacterium SAOS 7]
MISLFLHMKERVDLVNKKFVAGGVIGVAIILLIVGMMALNYGKSDDKQQEAKKEEQVAKEGIELKSLPEGSYEVQDNTITDTWGVVLVFDKLPADLQSKKGYTITIGSETYDLTLNKFNDNIFSGQVSSVKHSKEEVAAGFIKTK